MIVFAAFFTNLIIDGICVSFAIMVTDLVDHFQSTIATVMLMGSLLLGVYQIVGELFDLMISRMGVVDSLTILRHDKEAVAFLLVLILWVLYGLKMVKGA